MSDPITISSIPEISAIYYALLQCGYAYYSMNREPEHIEILRDFAGTETVPSFFCDVEQTTCEVYPYWPRAAILETAVFHLHPDHSGFADFDDFHTQIMTAGNLADCERDQALWNWIGAFPQALHTVLSSAGFRRYREWETRWLAGQNRLHATALQQINACLQTCLRQYHSPVQDIRIALSPIKCAYSADYHMVGSCFVFSAGAFRAESILHEFLHHVVHPCVEPLRTRILQHPRAYPGLDSSYYRSGDLNAFEEYAVRELTGRVMADASPADLPRYLESLL